MFLEGYNTDGHDSRQFERLKKDSRLPVTVQKLLLQRGLSGGSLDESFDT